MNYEDKIKELYHQWITTKDDTILGRIKNLQEKDYKQMWDNLPSVIKRRQELVSRSQQLHRQLKQIQQEIEEVKEEWNKYE